jgi:hypothetical protein
MDGGRAEAMAAAAPLLLLPRERERCAGGGARERKGRRMSDAKADGMVVSARRRRREGSRFAGPFPEVAWEQAVQNNARFRAKRGGKDGLYCRVAQLN